MVVVNSLSDLYTPAVAILLAIVGLGLLIVVHELGHMLVARAMGMRVERFSIGFGPTLVRWRGRRTTYQLALVPLGGFVQIAGMNPHEKLAPDDRESYASKSPTARFLTILAGPATNYLFAIVIMVGVTLAWGLPRPQLSVDTLVPGAPAEAAGLRPGDRFLSVAGRPASEPEAVIELIGASKGRPLPVRVERDGRTLLLEVVPRLEEGTYKIGVGFGGKIAFEPMSARNALLFSLVFPIDRTIAVLSGLGKLIRGKVSVKQVGGPVEIVRQLTHSFREGLGFSLLFLALLNVYLGLFNLLPIPALDGARLVFLGFTMVSRRPVNQRVENLVHTIGFVVLLGLILLVTYRDILRLLGSR
jgi:regulator of sigma E protease